MAAMHSLAKSKTGLIAALKTAYPKLKFQKGQSFVWSPTDATVHYTSARDDTFAYSLLHEVGHALLEHSTFKSDLDLLKLERDAWDTAVELSAAYSVEIPDEHIEHCIDTYRDWLYARSLCPNCKQCGLQTAKTMYQCVFCNHAWIVSESRLCKVTRRRVSAKR